ncbi:MAG: acyl-homoserine-lactone synthase [Lysobacterales bacterium CG_4_9_14_3_um_filter_62_6]|nr:MAG: acyl-homoserine-lactone synthase [Xanthomonadales bacterium CG_4_9_14_3_um_filter_62_6]
MHEIIIGRPSWRNISAPLLDSMYALRHAMFSDRLQWKVESQNGREKDWFDRLEPTYVVARSTVNSTTASGSWRLLPTTGPYMLKDVFPELLHGQAAPQDPRIWEASRFAVARDDDAAAFGLNETPIAMIREMLRFVRRNGVDEIVTVTSVGVERLIRNLGLKTQRFGPALQIGNVRTVALRVPMDDAAEWALWGCLEADLAQQQAAA